MLLALKGGGGPLRVVACRAFASEAWRGADGGGERWRDPPRWLRAGGFRLDLEELRGSCAELDLEVLPARCVASLGKRLGNAPAPAPPACLLVAATVYTIAAANAHCYHCHTILVLGGDAVLSTSTGLRAYRGSAALQAERPPAKR